MERRHTMTDGIISHDEEIMLFHVWDEYVTEMEYEQDRGGEPAVETEASSILSEDEAESIYKIFHSDMKGFKPWYKKALEIIEGFNLSYYHSEE